MYRRVVCYQVIHFAHSGRTPGGEPGHRVVPVQKPQVAPADQGSSWKTGFLGILTEKWEHNYYRVIIHDYH
jgi:hypothetical protein